MKMFKSGVCFSIIALLSFSSCNKVDKYASDDLSEYMNLEVGKYVRYNLDSLKFVFFGQRDTIIRYQAKDVVEAAITDNQGRPSWRIVRYLRDSASKNESDWKPSLTYMITPTREVIEVVENNLRFQKLKLPVINDFNWKGNSYIDTYNDFERQFFEGWDYTYENVGTEFTDSGRTSIPNTITVSHINTEGNIGNPTAPIIQKIFSKEVYAKNVGLVYKDFVKWDYQATFDTRRCYYYKCVGNKCDTIECDNFPNRCDSISELNRTLSIDKRWTQKCRDSIKTGFRYEGFGIKMKMIDHN
jgi:hypothetical protein